MEVARVGSLERVMRSNRRLPFDERQPRATRLEKPASSDFKSGALYNPLTQSRPPQAARDCHL
jgi:hypothetical protein